MPLDPLTASALVGAGSSVISNLFGASSTKKTNETNLKINKMNNEFNERMMQKQMDYNTLMWNKQNAYNTPFAQVARFKDAGLNPYVMSGQVSTGNAQSFGSTSAASAAPSAPQLSFQPNFQGIPDAILQAHQGQLLKAQTHGQVIDNQTRALKNMSEISDIMSRAHGQKLLNKLSGIQLNYADQMQQEMLRNQRLTNEGLETTNKNLIREGLLQQKELDIFDERIKLEFAQRAADILNTKSNSAYTKQLQIHEIQKLYETCARTQGIKISNKMAKDMAHDIVEKAHKENNYYLFDKASSAISTLLGGTLGFGLSRLGRHLDKVKPIKGFR